MNSTSYILRNPKTGLFFNGTNFSEENANKAVRFDSAPSAEAVKLVWACPVQVVAITAEQIEKLDLSDELEARAAKHLREVNGFKDAGRPTFGGGWGYASGAKLAAAKRLSQRATKIAVEVYATFPRWGIGAA